MVWIVICAIQIDLLHAQLQVKDGTDRLLNAQFPQLGTPSMRWFAVICQLLTCVICRIDSRFMTLEDSACGKGGQGASGTPALAVDARLVFLTQ